MSRYLAFQGLDFRKSLFLGCSLCIQFVLQGLQTLLLTGNCLSPLLLLLHKRAFFSTELFNCLLMSGYLRLSSSQGFLFLLQLRCQLGGSLLLFGQLLFLFSLILLQGLNLLERSTVFFLGCSQLSLQFLHTGSELGILLSLLCRCLFLLLLGLLQAQQLLGRGFLLFLGYAKLLCCFGKLGLQFLHTGSELGILLSLLCVLGRSLLFFAFSRLQGLQLLHCCGFFFLAGAELRLNLG